MNMYIKLNYILYYFVIIRLFMSILYIVVLRPQEKTHGQKPGRCETFIISHTRTDGTTVNDASQEVIVSKIIQNYYIYKYVFSKIITFFLFYCSPKYDS